jgi:hypothetical protein
MVRLAEAVGEPLRRGQGNRVESATPLAQTVHEAGCSRKATGKIIAAVARELLGFIWAIGIRAETIAGQQAAA